MGVLSKQTAILGSKLRKRRRGRGGSGFWGGSFTGGGARRSFVSDEFADVDGTRHLFVLHQVANHFFDLGVHSLELCGASLTLIETECTHAGALVSRAVAEAKWSESSLSRLAAGVAERHLGLLVRFASSLLRLPLVGIFLASLPASVSRSRGTLAFALLSTGSKASFAVLIVPEADLGAACARLRGAWTALVALRTIAGAEPPCLRICGAVLVASPRVAREACLAVLEAPETATGLASSTDRGDLSEATIARFLPTPLHPGLS